MPHNKTLHIVHTEASCGWGGQEIRILSEARGLSQRGHKVELLCPPESRIYQAAQNQGMRVQALPIGRKNLRGLMAMRAWLAGNYPDVINTHSSTDTWLTALARWPGKVPPMVRTRHISARVPTNRPTHWLYNRASARVVTTGERLRRELIERNNLAAERIISVPTGIDTQQFVPGDRMAVRAALELAADKTYVGIVATLRSWKGHDDLLEAIALIDDPRLHLLIVGGGPQQENLRNKIKALNIAGRVTMVGNQADVAPWFQALDLFVLPSYANEGVPQALLQAMACELPVISTPVGSIEEAVIDGETGHLVPPRKPVALQQAITKLISDTALGERLGRAARRRVKAHFARETMLDAMEALFQDVVGRSSSNVSYKANNC